MGFVSTHQIEIFFLHVQRYNDSYTKMIGAICGLGYTLDTSRPLFRENDIEITFDTIMDNNFLNSVNYYILLIKLIFLVNVIFIR